MICLGNTLCCLVVLIELLWKVVCMGILKWNVGVCSCIETRGKLFINTCNPNLAEASLVARAPWAAAVYRAHGCAAHGQASSAIATIFAPLQSQYWGLVSSATLLLPTLQTHIYYTTETWHISHSSSI